MAKNFVQVGENLTLPVTSDVKSGELVQVGDVIGVALTDAKTDDGTEITIDGTWRIKGDTFCRTWAKLDGGKEVCERWHLVAPNRVEVYVGKENVGVNSW